MEIVAQLRVIMGLTEEGSPNINEGDAVAPEPIKGAKGEVYLATAIPISLLPDTAWQELLSTQALPIITQQFNTLNKTNLLSSMPFLLDASVTVMRKLTNVVGKSVFMSYLDHPRDYVYWGKWNIGICLANPMKDQKMAFV